MTLNVQNFPLWIRRRKRRRKILFQPSVETSREENATDFIRGDPEVLARFSIFAIFMILIQY